MQHIDEISNESADIAARQERIVIHVSDKAISPQMGFNFIPSE